MTRPKLKPSIAGVAVFPARESGAAKVEVAYVFQASLVEERVSFWV